MNRSERLKAILSDGEPHCSFDVWRQLKTAPMRAAHELRKDLIGTGSELLTDGFHTHANEFGEASYAIYRLVKRPEQVKLPL